MVANASWSDDDLLESGSDLDELEITNICLMANSDFDEDAHEVNDSLISYDELFQSLDALIKDSKKVLKKMMNLDKPI